MAPITVLPPLGAWARSIQALGDKVTAEQAYRRALALEPKHKAAQAALKALKNTG
jgi:hypothetical protein